MMLLNIYITNIRWYKLIDNGLPWATFFSFFIWNIWLRRNKWVFKDKVPPHHLWLLHIRFLAWEWFSQQPNFVSTPTALTPFTPSTSVWIPPPIGSFKINCDASFHVSLGIAGLACICRDHLGTWVVGSGSKIKCSSPFHAEVLAIREALLLVTNVAGDSGIISSDCKKAVDEIQRPSLSNSVITNIIMDCRELLQALQGWDLIFERREYNASADLVARWVASNAHNSVSGLFWWNDPPSFVISTLCKDNVYGGSPPIPPPYPP
ncbi:uncharacterized protein LOC141629703 [Silene latifolia]|uniref:uncharacterized protein LOC141629703 n=1 Tax=Silene latifolia TaxID=37657 RepID=UPI003D77F344